MFILFLIVLEVVGCLVIVLFGGFLLYCMFCYGVLGFDVF